MRHLVRRTGEALKHAWKNVRNFFVPTHRRVIAGVLLGAVLLACYAFHPDIVVAQSKAAAPAPTGLNPVEQAAFWISGLLLYLASGIGALIAVLVDIIVAVLQYNKFSTSPIVSAGWAVVRDSINMFYVVLLIAIAFGTIVGYHKFDWSQQVPRLLRWAIIINFSKTLCGIAIDGSQVFTLTFANAIKDIAGGNFVSFLGLTSILTFSDNASFTNPVGADGITPIAASDYFFSSIMAVVMMLIVLGVLVALLVILVFRIVMLWILITVSPLTWFVGSAKGIIDSKAYATWWNNFKCYLVIGPVLTFFLWLALAVAGAGNIAATEGFAVTSTNTGILNQIFDMPRLTSFIIGLAIIWAGFDTANTFCQGVQGSVVQNALGKAKSFSKATALAPLQFGKSVGMGVGSRIPLVGARGDYSFRGKQILPNRNQLGAKLVRGAQSVTRQVPGFLGGAALTQKLGEAGEHFEHAGHEVAEQQAKRAEDLGKAFATDGQKMSFMKEAAGHSVGGKKSGRLAGNEAAILGNLKKAVENPEYRKKLEDAGVNVADLLQAYDHDIDHTFGHADEKFKASYKEFKEKNQKYFPAPFREAVAAFNPTTGEFPTEAQRNKVGDGLKEDLAMISEVVTGDTAADRQTNSAKFGARGGDNAMAVNLANAMGTAKKKGQKGGGATDSSNKMFTDLRNKKGGANENLNRIAWAFSRATPGANDKVDSAARLFFKNLDRHEKAGDFTADAGMNIGAQVARFPAKTKSGGGGSGTAPTTGGGAGATPVRPRRPRGGGGTGTPPTPAGPGPTSPAGGGGTGPIPPIPPAPSAGSAPPPPPPPPAGGGTGPVPPAPGGPVPAQVVYHQGSPVPPAPAGPAAPAAPIPGGAAARPGKARGRRPFPRVP